MAHVGSVQFLAMVEPIFCLALLFQLLRLQCLSKYRFLVSYLSIRMASWLALTLLVHASGTWVNPHTTYKAYFYVYWSSFAIEAMLSLGIVYELYKLAMAPLPGLQRLGMLMFRWAAGITSIVTIGLAVGPHISSQNFLIKAVLQLQQTESILTLCLLLFVTFAIRPMGLSFRSRIFGVSLGLGILATSDLLASAWLSRAVNLASLVNVLTGLIFIFSIAIWIIYFAVPEPKRQLIVLPTTSPFLRWNQISLALGDAPGFVAVGGIDPAFLAPAEIEIMERASLKMGALAYKS